MEGISGKVAIVTGGGSGIGKATVLELARLGASIGVAGLVAAEVEAVAAEILEGGGRAIAIPGDVTNPDFAVDMVSRTQSAFGPLQLAANCAGVSGGFHDFIDLPFASFHQTLSVNLLGIFHGMQAEIRAMLAAGGGAIVNIGSIHGSEAALAAHAGYSSSKYGLLGLSRSVALDYAAQGIRINVISPGLIDTPMSRQEGGELAPSMAEAIPMKHVGQPHDIARPACFLLSDWAAFITGTSMIVDGGYLLN